jgi:TolA-binding protein
MTRTTRRIPTVVLGAILAVTVATAQTGESDSRSDFKAKTMLDHGRDLLRTGQTERGVKLLEDVPRMFPNSPVRFAAHLELGRYYAQEGQFDRGIRHLRRVAKAQKDELKAEALYRLGIAYYELGQYGGSFQALRRVTEEYPGSVFANEAYYYIGLCHFKQGHWGKAVEALELVGTSVPEDLASESRAESGQRLYVKVQDKDLAILAEQGRELSLELTTQSGDVETIRIERLGRSDEDFIGSCPTEPGEPEKNDGVLQLLGVDAVTCTYIDNNTREGKAGRKVVAEVQMISTATTTFTDGAFREPVRGVFADGECFVRVKDLDRDVTGKPDDVTVKIWSQYKVELDAGAEAASLDETTEIRTRDAIELSLGELGEHEGVFGGSFLPKLVEGGEQADDEDGRLAVMQGDELFVEYVDEHHAGGDDPRTVRDSAKLLFGRIGDVKVEHRVVKDAELRARKNLIEAKMRLKLGEIFKELGLVERASEKADQGLERIEEVLAEMNQLDRSIVEEGFSVKWDLLLVQDELRDAIAVCRVFTRHFPDSPLVDEALFKIAVAKREAGEYRDAIAVFSEVLRLPRSERKPEAAYRIAEIYEQRAQESLARARQARLARGQTPDKERPNLSAAVQAYRRCADNYPDSAFAGRSLERIIRYYMAEKDYGRALELIEQVEQDYQDADFLDEILYQWVLAAWSTGQRDVAVQKARRLLSSYPGSKHAAEARNFLEAMTPAES